MMSDRRSTLAGIRACNPRSLVTSQDFVYTNACCLGVGSFGKVYLGWTKDGLSEVAVKVIDRTVLKKEPKMRENLEREIDILKLMAGCEYVVKILDAKELKNTILLTMELCDYDLDHLIKKSPLAEEQVVTFLYHLSEGMKVLRKKNIVHRDLKPGNILIKEDPVTRKMTFKLADFGFARRFKDDANRNIPMQSLAGTPVYMAPEALLCLFEHGKAYDDKVDIWSIGSLLYKVIVGDCGFHAHLDKILECLKLKQDAIAFNYHNGKVTYIEELPESVNARLSKPFREEMHKLLVHMLKVDARERMTFPVFFDFVDDIVTSKIEIIHLTHGTSFKILSDPNVNAETLVEKVRKQWETSQDSHIIFSPKCPHYIAPRRAISEAEFAELVDRSGGSYGHAKLYVLEIAQREKMVPDVTCFEQLKFAIDSGQITRLIIEARFSDDIVYMLECLRVQLQTQLEGLEKLGQFTMQQRGLSLENFQLIEEVHQTLARVSLAGAWLREEVGLFGDTSGRCGGVLELLTERQAELSKLAEEVRALSQSAPSLSGGFNLKEYRKTLTTYKDYAKRLNKAKDIPGKCSTLYEKCVMIIEATTSKTREQILPFSRVLSAMDELRGRSSKVLDVADLFSKVEEERGRLLHTQKQATPTPDTSHPVSSAGQHSDPSHQHSTLTDRPAEHRELARRVDHLTSQLANEHARSMELEAELARQQQQQQLELPEDSSTYTEEEEETVRSPVETTPTGNMGVANGGGGGGRGALGGELAELSEQLKLFCSEAQRISFPMPGAGFVTDLSSVAGDGNGHLDMNQLLIKSAELMKSLKANMPSLRALAPQQSQDDNGLPLRIGHPADYRDGDIAVFVPFKIARGIVPAVLHLNGNKPCMLMDVRNFKAFNIQPGKIPDLLFARLTAPPRCSRLENHERAAKDIGQSSGDFYRVAAAPVQLKLSDKCPLLLQK